MCLSWRGKEIKRERERKRVLAYYEEDKEGWGLYIDTQAWSFENWQRKEKRKNKRKKGENDGVGRDDEREREESKVK